MIIHHIGLQLQDVPTSWYSRIDIMKLARFYNSGAEMEVSLRLLIALRFEEVYDLVSDSASK